ncbi:MAG: hypothetical protein IH969_09410 [Candidatus Krumholzibacteriota bacterium]|nr:hypothetical protein [Candidatus Krumholzibacteriota bacterium]
MIGIHSRVPHAVASCAFAIALVVMTGACSNYTARSTLIKAAVAQGEYDRALEHVEEIDTNRSELLYLYEKGLVQHYQGDYSASNQSFEAAEHLLEELYTKSVIRELAALAITDNITKYRGDPFEAVLVNYYQVLNYLYLDDVEGALVECRQVNHKLQMISDSEISYFEDDPFVQYLTAMVYDIGGEASDAEVSYRVAVNAYQQLGERYAVTGPEFLYCDARNLAERLGDFAAAEEYDRGSPCLDAGPPVQGYGRVNLLLECGYVAGKREVNIVLPIFKNEEWDDSEEFAPVLAGRRGGAVTSKVDYWLKVALPELLPDPVLFDYAEVRPRPRREHASADSSFTSLVLVTAQTDLVENVDALAAIAFEEGQWNVLVRATTRALIKYSAKKGADSADASLGVLVNLFNIATESADTRSWSTLPQKILMTRFDLPEGVWDFDVALFDRDGRRTGSFLIEDIEVRSRRVDFLNFRVH